MMENINNNNNKFNLKNKVILYIPKHEKVIFISSGRYPLPPSLVNID